MKRKRFERITTGLVLLLTLCGYGVWGHISQNSRQGSGLVFSVSPQGVEALQAGTDARFSLDTATIKRPSILLHRNRYYNPMLGRFVSRDPIGFAGGMNLWAYTRGNPIRFKDPSGQIDMVVGPFDDKEVWGAIQELNWGLAGFSDLIILDSQIFSTTRDLLSRLESFHNNYQLNRLFFIGHGEIQGKFVFAWTWNWFNRIDHYWYSVNAIDYMSASIPICNPTFSPSWTYFFGCNTALGDPSVAKQWQVHTKGFTYGTTTKVALVNSIVYEQLPLPNIVPDNVDPGYFRGYRDIFKFFRTSSTVVRFPN